jgi:ABC-type proline/glycine betaine transport system substrate-binding protein
MKNKLFEELTEISLTCRKNYRLKKKEFFEELKKSLYHELEINWVKAVDEVLPEIKNGQNFVMLLWEPYKNLFEEYQLKYFENEKLFSPSERFDCLEKYSKIFERWFKNKGFFVEFGNYRGRPPDIYIRWYTKSKLSRFKEKLVDFIRI